MDLPTAADKIVTHLEKISVQIEHFINIKSDDARLEDRVYALEQKLGEPVVNYEQIDARFMEIESVNAQLEDGMHALEQKLDEFEKEIALEVVLDHMKIQQDFDREQTQFTQIAYLFKHFADRICRLESLANQQHGSESKQKASEDQQPPPEQPGSAAQESKEESKVEGSKSDSSGTDEGPESPGPPNQGGRRTTPKR